MDLKETETALRAVLHSAVPPLKVSKEGKSGMEVCGTKKVMQGRQMVDGHYFASIVAKPKDIRLYYFPIYTHPDQFELSDGLKKMLKGKSCFHVKNPDQALLDEISRMIRKGIELYQADGLI